MNIKQVLAGCMAALFLFSSCGSGEEAEERMEEVQQTVASVVQEEKTEPLILAVGRDFASTQPACVTDTAGNSVLPLLYQSLVTVDEQYHWQGDLAEEIEQNGLDYTVSLKEAVFSDGSTVRASDVVSSLYSAKEEASCWYSRLSVVEDCVVLNERKLRITLKETRQEFENLLTFPVRRENRDGSFLGSGAYQLQSDEEGQWYLEANPYYNGEPAVVETIALTTLPNRATLYDSFRIGKISCLYDDLSSGEAMKLSERTQTVEIGHLVFLGVQCQEGWMKDTAVRRAISAAIDRETLVERVYASKAVATSTPFHPSYYRLTEETEQQLSYEEIRQLLLDAGLTQDDEGYFVSEEQDRLRIVYHSENSYRQQAANLLEQMLQNINIRSEWVPLTYEEYMEALRSGDFDLYLGELEIDESMDVCRLLERGVNYGFGCENGSSVLTVYQAYQQGNAALSLFVSVYQQNLPAIPLLYRQGLIVYDEAVEAEMVTAVNRPFARVTDR